MTKNFLVSGAIVLALTATTALAGNAGLKNAKGGKLRINCKNECIVQSKPKGGKWGTVEKTEATTDNFNMLVAKYKGQGYK